MFAAAELALERLVVGANERLFTPERNEQNAAHETCGQIAGMLIQLGCLLQVCPRPASRGGR